jgi:hypothetical protein
MKKILVVFNFVKDAVNALLGSLVAIGFIEVINLIISIYIGEYVRIDGGSLEKVLEMYMFLGLYGYALSCVMIFTKKISKNNDKDIMQKTKEIIIVVWITMFILNIISGIILSELSETLRLNLMYSAMFGGSLLFIYMYDKIVINRINKQIKENIKEED